MRSSVSISSATLSQAYGRGMVASAQFIAVRATDPQFASNTSRPDGETISRAASADQAVRLTPKSPPRSDHVGDAAWLGKVRQSALGQL